MGLIMIKLKKILKEGYVWDRKFGEPLPTLNSILDKANEDHSGCTEDVCTCEDVNEVLPKDQKQAGKIVLKLMKLESEMRKEMFDLSKIVTGGNSSDQLKTASKKGVTTFMKTAVKLGKKKR